MSFAYYEEKKIEKVNPIEPIIETKLVPAENIFTPELSATQSWLDIITLKIKKRKLHDQHSLQLNQLPIECCLRLNPDESSCVELKLINTKNKDVSTFYINSKRFSLIRFLYQPHPHLTMPLWHQKTLSNTNEKNICLHLYDNQSSPVQKTQKESKTFVNLVKNWMKAFKNPTGILPYLLLIDMSSEQCQEAMRIKIQELLMILANLAPHQTVYFAIHNNQQWCWVSLDDISHKVITWSVSQCWTYLKQHWKQNLLDYNGTQNVILAQWGDAIQFIREELFTKTPDPTSESNPPVFLDYQAFQTPMITLMISTSMQLPVDPKDLQDLFPTPLSIEKWAEIKRFHYLDNQYLMHVHFHSMEECPTIEKNPTHLLTALSGGDYYSISILGTNELVKNDNQQTLARLKEDWMNFQPHRSSISKVIGLIKTSMQLTYQDLYPEKSDYTWKYHVWEAALTGWIKPRCLGVGELSGRGCGKIFTSKNRNDRCEFQPSQAYMCCLCVECAVQSQNNVTVKFSADFPLKILPDIQHYQKIQTKYPSLAFSRKTSEIDLF